MILPSGLVKKKQTTGDREINYAERRRRLGRPVSLPGRRGILTPPRPSDPLPGRAPGFLGILTPPRPSDPLPGRAPGFLGILTPRLGAPEEFRLGVPLLFRLRPEAGVRGIS